MFSITILLLTVPAFQAAPPARTASPPANTDENKITALVGGKVVWNAESPNPVYDPGVVIFRGKTIVAAGPAKSTVVPEGATVVDAAGNWVVPGIIDLHNHTGAGGSGNDLHEYTHLTNPDLRMTDAVKPECDDMIDALVGGVTTILTIPGSGNNMSGFGVLMKTGGLPRSEAFVSDPGALKVAQAGNPESYMVGVGRSFMNWSTRDQLTRGKEYTKLMSGMSPEERRKSPKFNPQLEDMIYLFEHTRPVAVHTQQHQVQASTVRILNKDLGLHAFIDHGEFNGYLNAPEIIKYGVYSVIGPRGFYKNPATGRVSGLMAEYWERGIRDIGTNTDSPVVPQQELTYQAAMGVRLGFPDTQKALRGVTIFAARVAKVEQRLGSLEAGKDADVCIWTGDPIDPRSRVLKAYVNGKLRYNEKRDGMRH